MTYGICHWVLARYGPLFVEAADKDAVLLLKKQSEDALRVIVKVVVHRGQVSLLLLRLDPCEHEVLAFAEGLMYHIGKRRCKNGVHIIQIDYFCGAAIVLHDPQLFLRTNFQS